METVIYEGKTNKKEKPIIISNLGLKWHIKKRVGVHYMFKEEIVEPNIKLIKRLLACDEKVKNWQSVNLGTNNTGPF
jgi:hypothetical protein